MKRISQEIIEVYRYNSFDEFNDHYNQMLKEGYVPNSDSCKPEFFHNHDLNSYVIQYSKKTNIN